MQHVPDRDTYDPLLVQNRLVVRGLPAPKPGVTESEQREELVGLLRDLASTGHVHTNEVHWIARIHPSSSVATGFVSGHGGAGAASSLAVAQLWPSEDRLPQKLVEWERLFRAHTELPNGLRVSAWSEWKIEQLNPPPSQHMQQKVSSTQYRGAAMLFGSPPNCVSLNARAFVIVCVSFPALFPLFRQHARRQQLQEGSVVSIFSSLGGPAQASSCEWAG
jgi:hypothetical protein